MRMWGRLRWGGFAVAGTFAVLFALAASARAAFPGRDGLLAVQPLDGEGIVLVGANGRGERRICASVAVCGHPRSPRFAADGRSVVFSGPGIRLVGIDGSCLDCLFGAARDPAFFPGGTLITFVSEGGVFEDSIDGLRQATIIGPTDRGARGVSDAVWSAAGRLAAVRAGRIWVGAPGRLHSIGAGGDPSWSPNGSRLAVARHGWVVVVGADGRDPRRLARGSAPAFSPDGRWVAFIGEEHRLEIVGSRGGRARRVGGVTGAAVDWQPIPRHRRAACVTPAGSKVIARSGRAVVTVDVGPTPPRDGQLPGQAAMGCLFAQGQARVLERFLVNGVDSANAITMAAIGGDYAALVSRDSDEHYGGYSESTSVFDLRRGVLAGHGGEADGCAGFDPACGGIDRVLVGSDGVSAVHVDGGPGGNGIDPVQALACASPSLCIASDHYYGNIDSSSAPASGPWIASQVATLNGASCPSALLCVATAGPSPVSDIYTSTTPAGGAGAWVSTELPGSPALGAISCPSTAMCVATTSDGDVVVSTDPTGGAGNWSRENVDGSNGLNGISCPSTSECVATDRAGNIVSSTNPTGGPSVWTVHQIAAPPLGITGISCASTSLCVAIEPTGPTNPDGGILVSTAPTSGAWTKTPIPNNPNAIDCPTSSLCVAVGAANTIEVSTDPTSGAWTSYTVSHDAGPLASISCPDATFCLTTGDGAGQALVSTDPTGGPAAWTPVLADPITCPPSAACGTEDIIASDRTGTHTLDAGTEFEAQTGPQLTGLTLNADTLSWRHSGTQRTYTLTP